MAAGTGYPPYDWRIDEIERKANRAANADEVTTLRSRVDCLEHSLREIGAVVDGLRSELQAATHEIAALKQTREE